MGWMLHGPCSRRGWRARMTFIESQEEEKEDSIERLVKERLALNNIGITSRRPKTDPGSVSRRCGERKASPPSKKQKKVAKEVALVHNKTKLELEKWASNEPAILEAVVSRGCQRKKSAVEGNSKPRLKLHAALPSSKLAYTVMEKHDLKPGRRVFWSDSRTVLSWIRAGARTYKPFVVHRIDRQIRKKHEEGGVEVGLDVRKRRRRRHT
ncbi:hypothetical protein EVAR_23948_1 [Eumeta japonica]|uniref:Uncharacterized protein n=1 Tax=Eumeta variegata TaxID=151549 RepID=A0A4C1V2M2_EUMVA|nr:hypothetical protein EVAR_23948_1 [Eumeta japonica]